MFSTCWFLLSLMQNLFCFGFVFFPVKWKEKFFALMLQLWQ